LSFFDIAKLRVDDFKALLRDAYIHKLNSTETGREYLEKCWILDQTSPERSKLRERFGKPRE
jgi:hypothetical protein